MGVGNGFFLFACDVLHSFRWYLAQMVLDEFWLRLLVVDEVLRTIFRSIKASNMEILKKVN